MYMVVYGEHVCHTESAFQRRRTKRRESQLVCIPSCLKLQSR